MMLPPYNFRITEEIHSRAANLWQMKNFYEVYGANAKLAQLGRAYCLLIFFFTNICFQV
jgi:hypothetical protein